MTLSGGFKVLSREGEHIPAIGLTITMKNNGKNTQDAYSLFEYSVPGGVNGPPLHTHTREDESFVCLAGKLEVTLGGEEFTIGFGDYLYLPRSVPHAFRNPYDEESRVISVVSPAGLEAYYQALSEMPPGPMDFTKVKAIMDDFGIEMDLPPGH
ncbi:MAG TPA: cupin domain-containing protein [Nocardioides sp.]|jgi:quercetin dioxygenase-like cupin family protein|uniref:cupin domain-containing protein n=1 Tax=Nocardioides sp. TaxID=35761 RepID=UPI002E3720E2|nr:cupin domain-containing protein [Nocardioides sp.]HEX3930014.1 cupin domain-containing protein [Nocardioides sp.]